MQVRIQPWPPLLQHYLTVALFPQRSRERSPALVDGRLICVREQFVEDFMAKRVKVVERPLAGINLYEAVARPALSHGVLPAKLSLYDAYLNGFRKLP